LKKTILEVYALAVCFATIICFVIALGIAVYNVIQIINPEFTLSSYEYDRHQSNDAFWKNDGCGYDKEKKLERPPEEELAQRRLESYRQVIKSEKRDASQSLTVASIIIAIDVIVFLVHWRVARRARETTA
jgi:hypothetical protein